MLPLFGWVGVIALISLLFTASIPYFARKGKLSFKLHFLMAKITVGLGIIHGILAILRYT